MCSCCKEGGGISAMQAEHSSSFSPLMSTHPSPSWGWPGAAGGGAGAAACGSSVMDCGVIRKQPTGYEACTSPSRVGSSCRQPRFEAPCSSLGSSLTRASRELNRAHTWASDDRMSMHVPDGLESAKTKTVRDGDHILVAATCVLTYSPFTTSLWSSESPYDTFMATPASWPR